MKEHVQKTGVRKYAGDDLIELQAEPLNALQDFLSEYGNYIIKGCEVTLNSDNTYNIAPGLVALEGNDEAGQPTFKVAPFAGAENITLPIYLTLANTVSERVYGDGKVKPIAYNYTAVATGIEPAEGVPFLEITAAGGKLFTDAIKVTEKLDKMGNGKDVTVTFAESATRENVSSGEKLSGLFGKIQKWLSGLKTVAFTGQAADITQDASHRFVTDAEKTGWDDKYTKALTYTRAEVEQKIANVVNSAPGTLDTLQELAAALGNDPNFATSIMTLIAGKADRAHSHAISEVANLQNELNGKMGIRILPAGTDLNTVVNSGTYRVYENNLNTPPIPCTHGNMLVMKGADTATQIITDYQSSKMYYRSGNPPECSGGGIWHPWREIWHSGNFNPNSKLDKNVTNYAPVGASYLSAEELNIGVKIRLPFSMESGKMTCFTVRMYSGYHAYDVQFSGYLYPITKKWYNPKASTISITTSIDVKMGVDTDGIAYVWLRGGEWTGVSVLDIVGCFKVADWNSGWEILRTDSCPGVALEKTLYPNANENQLALKADASHSHDTAYASKTHTHNYEPAFSKNTAFNKNFGTTAGTVAQGDHSHPSKILCTGKVKNDGIAYFITPGFTITRTGKGVYKISHTFGHTNYGFIGTGFNFSQDTPTFIGMRICAADYCEVCSYWGANGFQDSEFSFTIFEQ